MDMDKICRQSWRCSVYSFNVTSLCDFPVGNLNDRDDVLLNDTIGYFCFSYRFPK